LSPHQTIWSKRCLDNAESFAGYASKNTARWPRKGVSQVRSIAAFQNCIDSVSPFSCLHMLRVLDLEDCSLEGSKKLSIGNLIHLRYLRIKTDLEVLPRGIGKLQFLQVLIRERGGVELPESIFGLPQLMCLQGVVCCPRTGNQLRNLTASLLRPLQFIRTRRRRPSPEMTRVTVARDMPARFLRRWRSPALSSSALAATASTQRATRPRSSARGSRPSHDLSARMASRG
jgi:hypothetical protein